MDKELEQAIQTFGMAPEFYQKVFQDAGANFPDDLVTAIKEDPNKAGELVMSDNNLKNAVISIFKQNKEALFKYIQQQNTTAMKNGGKFDYLDKLQKGGNLSRREALNYAQQNKGYTAEQARRAYLNAKNALRSQGLRGRELRQAARNNIAWTQPQEVNNQISESTPEIALQEKTFTPISNLEIKRNTPTTTKVVRPARVVNAPQSEKVILTNPSTVTSSKGSLTRGPVYTITPPAQTTPVTEESNIVITPLPESEQAAHDAYIKSLREKQAQRPVIDYAAGFNTQWGPEVDYTTGKRMIQYVPGANARFYKWEKQGGKLEKENEINKKYIKDSEKAGEKASKKMTDLKKKHKAKLKKIK